MRASGRGTGSKWEGLVQVPPLRSPRSKEEAEETSTSFDYTTMDDTTDLSKGFLQHIESLGGIRILSSREDSHDDVKELMSCSSFSDCDSSGEEDSIKDRRRTFKTRQKSAAHLAHQVSEVRQTERRSISLAQISLPPDLSYAMRSARLSSRTATILANVRSEFLRARVLFCCKNRPSRERAVRRTIGKIRF